MRIFISADPYLPIPPTLYGGTERVIDSLVRGFAARGHSVGLMALAESTTTPETLFPWPVPGIDKGSHAGHLKNAKALHRAVHTFKPDVLHSFSRLLYMLPLAVTYRRLPKVMTYERQPTPNTARKNLLIHGHSLRFTGCSEDLCTKGRPGGGVWKPVHNCVDIDHYRFGAEVTEDAPLVFLSRVERIKGVHTAIAAARRTGRRLLIAGNHDEEGIHGDYWREEIVPHLDKDGIEYIGPVNDEQKNKLLGEAAAMVVPIEWDEPFGIVFAEALACGTPIISSPRGSLPEIVRQGVDGFLVNNLDEACDAIRKLHTIDRAQCRARAESCFSEDFILDGYMNIYLEAIAGSMA
ncbi:MAG: glycosyltransferase [Magnetococcales bacterium]|nr:glycosyltransferase [Magnetococcales bacterium]